jgi:phage FluMu gp28-like protein
MSTARGVHAASTSELEATPKRPKGRAPETFFMPYQAAWIQDTSLLKICEKGRQIGLTYADSYDSVRKAAAKNGKDVWVMSRDEVQAKQYIIYCKRWANVLKYAASDIAAEDLFTEEGRPFKAQVITFASGASIYALSSNPDAIVGKSGHVKLDEFALHKDQRQLYAVAKPVIQWGGTLSIISTHRGVGTVFNELIEDVRHRGNKIGWSLHTLPIQKAVEQGIVEKINAATGREESRADWLARQRAECIDEEQWLQEYCCVPADESQAFITYDMIAACEDDSARKDFNYLLDCKNPLYLGADIARKQHLTVFDVEEKVGDVMWERLRIEMRGKTFDEQEFELYRLLALPQLRRACIDATGLGMQLAERAQKRFGEYRVEAVRFSAQSKEEIAYPLRSAHEDRTLRYAKDEALRKDLRGIKKETTASGNIRFVGDSEDSHCDRFWAKALALHAGKTAGRPMECILV